MHGSFLNYLVREVNGRPGEYAAYHDDLKKRDDQQDPENS
jgi:hypothetical protein